jgi:hypothetical protein
MFPIQARFNGDLMADGSISGTFFQLGSTGLPLVLTRSQSVPDPPAFGRVENGRYHHDQTGLEFDVPPGFSVLGTGDYIDNEGKGRLVSGDSVRIKTLVQTLGGSSCLISR